MDYPYIRAWGRMLHSFEYYITQQVEEARRDRAPQDAIYRNHDTGSWVTFAAVTNEGTRQHILSLVEGEP